MSHLLLHAVTAISVLVGIGAGAAVLFVPLGSTAEGSARRRVALWRVATAVGAMALILFLQFPVYMSLGLGFFGIVRLAYAQIVVAVPLLAATALVLRRRANLTPAAAVAAMAGVLLAPVGLWSTFVEPTRLQLERAAFELPPDRAGSSPIRIGVLSDLQTFDVGDYEHEVVTRLLAEEPDLILLPGDFFHPCHDDERAAALPELRSVLERVRAPFGAYAVPGDVETAEQLVFMLDGTGIVPLVDETVRLRVRDREITLFGASGRAARAHATRRLQTFVDVPGDGDVRIVVAHRPDEVLWLPSASRCDLVVSGHTHGGQVVIPFYGPPLTLTGVPRHVAAGGLHMLDGNRIYVSRGVGLERGQAPRLRFNCPPEITVIEIR